MLDGDDADGQQIVIQCELSRGFDEASGVSTKHDSAEDEWCATTAVKSRWCRPVGQLPMSVPAAMSAVVPAMMHATVMPAVMHVAAAMMKATMVMGPPVMKATVMGSTVVKTTGVVVVVVRTVVRATMRAAAEQRKGASRADQQEVPRSLRG